jgi:hypothetical protein
MAKKAEHDNGASARYAPSMSRGGLVLALLLPLAAGCGQPRRGVLYPAVFEAVPGSPERAGIEAVLDDLHLAASEADGRRYFSHFAAGAVFIGTDETERWDIPAFKAFADPVFSEGRGWTYVPRERHVYLGTYGTTAWFDERLWNEKYGACRGTGVMVRVEERWKIAQYNLAFPVPNELTPRLVELIRAG